MNRKEKPLQERALDMLFDLKITPWELTEIGHYNKEDINRLYSYEGSVKFHNTLKILMIMEPTQDVYAICGTVVLPNAYYNVIENTVDIRQKELITDKQAVDLYIHCKHNNITLKFWVDK